MQHGGLTAFHNLVSLICSARTGSEEPEGHLTEQLREVAESARQNATHGMAAIPDKLARSGEVSGLF